MIFRFPRRPSSFAICISLLLVCLPRETANGQQPSESAREEIPNGKLIERVACRADTSQNYSLYLPSTYAANRKWPIIYSFDPGARGARAVEHLKAGAEKYGFIIVGSNNSRNGPWPPTVSAFQAMWEDTHARFPLDERRIYTAGLSGGARVACRLGYALKGEVAGVIACSAGLPEGIEPSAPMPFALFTTAGVEDFNYSELKRLSHALNDLKVTNHFEVFEGGHEWAPSDVCTMAVAWMELQAMKKGTREKDAALIESLFKNSVENADSLQASGRPWRAWAAYNQIAADFRGLHDVAEIDRKAGQVKESRELIRAAKHDEALDAEERRRSIEIQTLRASIVRSAGSGPLSRSSSAGSDDADNASRSVADLRRVLSELKKRSESPESSDDRALARRLLNGFLVGESETSSALMQSKRYDLAIETLQMDAALMPDRPRIFFNLACAYSLKGDKKRALEALTRAVEKGFNSADELQRNPALDSLRQEQAFKKIVEDLQRTNKTN